MSKKNINFNLSAKKLLEKSLTPARAQSLKDLGYSIKNPTGYDAVAVALFEKAVSGDLSAIKELRSIVTNENAVQSGVVILDDTKSP